MKLPFSTTSSSEDLIQQNYCVLQYQCKKEYISSINTTLGYMDMINIHFKQILEIRIPLQHD